MFEQELGALFEQMKSIAIPLMRQIDGPDRAGMATAQDVDTLLALLQSLAESDGGRSHLGRAFLDFLPTAREASLQDLREAGKLMIDGQDRRPDELNATTGRQEDNQP